MTLLSKSTFCPELRKFLQLWSFSPILKKTDHYRKSSRRDNKDGQRSGSTNSFTQGVTAYTRTFSSTKDDTGEQQVSIKSWVARRGWAEASYYLTHKTWGLLNDVSRRQVQEHIWGWILFSIKRLAKQCNSLPQDVVDVNSSHVVRERCTQTWKKISPNFFALRNCTGRWGGSSS